jgi:hypothetical protein
MGMDGRDVAMQVGVGSDGRGIVRVAVVAVVVHVSVVVLDLVVRVPVRVLLGEVQHDTCGKED